MRGKKKIKTDQRSLPGFIAYGIPTYNKGDSFNMKKTSPIM